LRFIHHSLLNTATLSKFNVCGVKAKSKAAQKEVRIRLEKFTIAPGKTATMKAAM
jgi:hypothetical protein